MGGDGQGEGRDNAAGLAAANRRIDLQSGRQTDQMIGQRIGQKIDRRTGHRTGRRIGRRIDRATTSLTPYGMSVWALILAACGGGGGGGGGGGPTTSGPVPVRRGLSRMIASSSRILPHNTHTVSDSRLTHGSKFYRTKHEQKG